MAGIRLPCPTTTIGLLAAAALALAGLSGPAGAQSRLEASYAATVGGLSFGSGSLVIDLGSREYAATGSGQVDGLMRLFSGTHGTIAAHGRLNREHPLPGSYRADVSTDQYDYVVHMEMQGGNVVDLIARPPMVPAPDRVPVTDAHRRGVLDPATAVIMPVAGSSDVLGPAACERTLPIFDGHQRFNVVLSFKRMDKVKAQAGYEGPAVVCTALYRPVAGHRPGRFAIRYLQERRDIEMWLAPIAGTRVVVPFRVSVPTLIGTAVIEAERFVAVPSGPVRRPAHAGTGTPAGAVNSEATGAVAPSAGGETVALGRPPATR